jgi:hypothetical protein
MKIYLICPVRNINEEMKEQIDGYVAEMESQGHFVHYPPRDVDQSDPVGDNIITKHRFAMLQSDEVHIFFDPDSKGSCFDLGMFWMMKWYNPDLKLKCINTIEKSVGKSFENVILKISKNE